MKSTELYWLCSELFESRETGLIAALLLSLSSFHLVYAQEARPYSLWALLVMVSSALLMVAMRRTDVPSWSAYCVALILTLYTQLLSVFVALAHLLFCLITERFHLSRNVRSFLVCLGIAFVTLVPWIVAGVSCGGFENSSDHFTALKVSPARFSSSWSNNLCWLYLCHRDCSYSGLVVALEIGALLSLLLPVAKKTRIFLFALISCSVLPLLIPDLVCGGQRSTVARYLTPALVGLSAAVASLFSRGLSARHKAVRYTTVACLLFLLIGQGQSCWLYIQKSFQFFFLAYWQ